MKRLVPILLAIGLLVAAPINALANAGGGMTLDITFLGSCDVDGYIEVDNVSANFVVFEKQDDWSAAQRIHHVLGATPIADAGQRLVLRLFAADHTTVLFETDEFTHQGSEAAYISDFTAALDCSDIPYRVVISDTAVAPPDEHSLSALGWVALVVGIAMAANHARRSATWTR